ncbi:PQQ-dependent sugar dehydrogenase [Candidatus Methylacidithermus pantelleriae]|nr:PQQ-dependent sugar dehydrogenase [Candidatus Methylacidithermus pantelleriae]
MGLSKTFLWGFFLGNLPLLQASQDVPEIQVNHFEPKPLVIRIGDLPPPFATPSAEKPFQKAPLPSKPTLNLPPGFTVTVFAKGFQSPRWLAQAPDGSVLVVESYGNRIWRIPDPQRSSLPASSELFATEANGLRIPFGVVFVRGWCYVACEDRLLRFPYRPGQSTLSGEGQILAWFPGGGHSTRSLAASKDGKSLFVGIGSWGNVGIEPAPRACILRMNLDGKHPKVFASGMRNPVGLAIEPKTGDLYAVVNERDGLGDDLVPDYLARVHEGDFYGWPYAYLSPSLLDPRIRLDNPKILRLIARTRTPEILFHAHSAPLGLVFLPKETTFPSPYRHGAFVTLHGSWNRSVATGYKIVFVPFSSDGRPYGFYQDFLTGFLLDPSIPLTWGRPVGLLALLKGGLLFCDELHGIVYKVDYVGPEETGQKIALDLPEKVRKE